MSMRQTCAKVAILVLLAAGSARAAPGGPPPLPRRPKGDPVVELAWKLGTKAASGALAPEVLLYGCSDVAACAGACAESLTAIGDGRSRSTILCPELQGAQDVEGTRRRAEAFVRRRLTESAAKIRGSLGAADRDRLDCGLQRVRGQETGSACASAEARALPDGLAAAGAIADTEQQARALATLCAETAACGRNCVAELRLFSNVSWTELKRVVGGDSCSLLAALRKGVPEQAAARGTAWVKERLLGAARGACGVVDGPSRARLSCASVAAGLAPAPGVCGDPGGPCPPARP